MGMSTQRQPDGTILLVGDTAEVCYRIVVDGVEIASYEVMAKSEADQSEAEKSVWRLAADRLVKGAAGIVTVAVGLDRPATEVIEDRLRACSACHHLRGPHCGRLLELRGKACGCVVAVKARRAREQCPESYW